MRRIDDYPVFDQNAHYGVRTSNSGGGQSSCVAAIWIECCASASDTFPSDGLLSIPTYKVRLCASEDRGLERFWKNKYIAASATPEKLKASLGAWLQQAYEQLNHWRRDERKFGTRIRPRP